MNYFLALTGAVIISTFWVLFIGMIVQLVLGTFFGLGISYGQSVAISMVLCFLSIAASK